MVLQTQASRELAILQKRVVACEKCPRLVSFGKKVAREKRRAYRDCSYWGKPVPSFGDPQARLLIIGLAPGAHGANRTGRMFTGDSSGDFLYPVLHEAGFASQPESVASDDGLRLLDAYITAPVRCAPPDNRPTPAEFRICRPYLERELQLLKNVVVIIALGRLALASYLGILKTSDRITATGAYPFAHGACHKLPAGLPALLCSYHPSRQNTQTGRLTKSMFLKVFRSARTLIGKN
jgi:uracil-DNA glycosylase family 4